MFPKHSFRPTWAEINLDRLRSHVRLIHRYTGLPLIGVVKADAYGHGADEVSRVLRQEGVNIFAVATLDEAIELREAGIEGEILLLGPLNGRGYEEIFLYRLTPAVVSLEYAFRLHREAERRNTFLPVHVEIDTGMGRYGIHFTEAVEKISEIMALKSLRVEGMFSHFPSAESDEDFSREQVRRFREVMRFLEERGMSIPFSHMANSAAVWCVPDAYGENFTHVRPGLSLYGVAPRPVEGLLPVMSLKTRIVQLRVLSRGETVSYLRQYTVSLPREVIAVLPVGYADGIPVLGSGRYEVAIRGKKYPQVGRVCMDSMMVSLGTNPDGLEEGEEVEIFGDTVSIEEFGRRSQRIPYEVMCGISKRVPRIYKERE